MARELRIEAEAVILERSAETPQDGLLTGAEITVVFRTWSTFLTCSARWNRAPLISVPVLTDRSVFCSRANRIGFGPVIHSCNVVRPNHGVTRPKFENVAWRAVGVSPARRPWSTMASPCRRNLAAWLDSATLCYKFHLGIGLQPTKSPFSPDSGEKVAGRPDEGA